MFLGLPKKVAGFDVGGCSPWLGWGREGSLGHDKRGRVGLEVRWELKSRRREFEEKGFAINVLVWERVMKGRVGLALESGASVTIGDRSEFIKEERHRGEGEGRKSRWGKKHGKDITLKRVRSGQLGG